MEDFNKVEQREANSFTTSLNNDIKSSDSRSFFSNDQQNNRQATENMVQNGTLPGLDLFGSQNATNAQGDKTAGGTADGAPRNSETKPPSPNGDATAGGKNTERTSAPSEANAPKDSSGVIPVGPGGDSRQNTEPDKTGTANDNQSSSQDSATRGPESDLESVPGDKAAEPERGQDGNAGQSRAGTASENQSQTPTDAQRAPEGDTEPTPGDTKSLPPRGPEGDGRNTVPSRGTDSTKQTLNFFQ